MAREPKAEVEISAHSRGLAAKLRSARAKFGTFGAELKKNVFGKDLVEKGFWGKAGASMVGNVSANAFGFAANALVEQGKAVFNFEDRLNRLQIATGKTPEQMRAFASSIRAASNETGIGADKILDGAHAYVALTGDMEGAIAKQREFAVIAQATGSEVSEIAGAAASLKQNLKVVDSDTIAAFSALATQGKEGAIELKDLASQLSTIAPMWAQFEGGTGMQGLKELGSALQVVKRGFGGDAGETVTGLSSLLTAIQKNAGRFSKAGIKVFDKDPTTGAKTMRNVLDIVQSIGDSKLAKDPTALAKAFGRVEAYRAFLQLSQNRDMLNDLIAKSSDAGVIQRDLQARLQSTAGRTQVAFENAKNAIAEVFTPERIEAFAQSLAFIIDKAAKLVGFIDKIATGVDKIVNAPKNDAVDRGRLLGKRQWADAMQMAGGDKAAAAQAMLTEAARAQRKMEDEGFRGSKKFETEGQIAELRERAHRMREEADMWSSTGDASKHAASRRVQPDSGLSPEQQTRANSQLLQLQLASWKKELAVAIREGLQGFSVQADGKALTDVTRNSSRARTRPGG